MRCFSVAKYPISFGKSFNLLFPMLSVKRLIIPLIPTGKVVNSLSFNLRSAKLLKFAIVSGKTLNLLPVTCECVDRANRIATKCGNNVVWRVQT